MKNTIFATAAMVALSSAAPAATPNYSYVTEIAAYTNGSIFDNGVAINFNKGKAFIGKPTTFGCPPGPGACAQYNNVTGIAVDIDYSDRAIAASSTTAGLQYLYIASTGELSYTAPGKTRPSNGQNGPFNRNERFSASNAYLYNFYTFYGQDWFACPTSDGAYTIHPAVMKAPGPKCVEFEMRAVDLEDNPRSPAYKYLTK